jgi:hypothetical protein|tara:strand:+ start:127 stop:522 length:396 start_codon:yes stop_codon:yes gene_type:complete
MKKDLQIPLVSGVEIAMIYEYNELYKTDDWNVYIINNNKVDIEMIVIVSQGFSETKKSTLLRKKLDTLPANSFAKVEFVQPELFVLNNRFQVSFFENNQLKDKTYLFEKNTIKEGSLRLIPEIKKRGILAK